MSDQEPDPAAVVDEIDQPVVLFDGVCNFCNRTLRLLVRVDHDGRFLFAPLQSPVGTELLERHGLDADYFESLVLVADGEYYTKSTAALRICRELDGPLPLLYAGILLPERLRDRIYEFVADHRYQLFGKTEACQIPPPEIRDRFTQRSLD